MSIRDTIEIIDYKNKNHIKSLLLNFLKLEELKEKGNTTAICIRLDLQYALSRLPSPTVDILKMYYIQGFTYTELTEMFFMGRATINRHLDKGIKEIVETLNAPRNLK